MPLHITIAVGGRFHADFMANALVKAGHRVRLLTSYPRSRFPALSREVIEPHIASELGYRFSRGLGLERLGEHFKMRSFGAAAARALTEGPPPDVFIAWSSFALEAFRLAGIKQKILVRDSTHIQHQSEILKTESQFLRLPFIEDRLCIDRELEEYDLADRILVLSHFAKQTFVDRGVQESKIHVLALGVNTSIFKPRKQYQPKAPLRAIYFGSLSVRKGTYYLLEAMRNIDPEKVRLYLIGPIEKQMRPFLRKHSNAIVLGTMPHNELAQFIRGMDLYVFPTLEDGFPNTLVQAMASGLPPITTGNNGPAERIEPNVHGFIVPPRNSKAIYDALMEVVRAPEALMAMRERALELASEFSWDNYGRRLTHWIENPSKPIDPSLEQGSFA